MGKSTIYANKKTSVSLYFHSQLEIKFVIGTNKGRVFDMFEPIKSLKTLSIKLILF